MNRVVSSMPGEAGLSTHASVEHRWYHRANLSAVLVGSAVALTVGIALTALGTAIGTGLVDTVNRDTPSAQSFTVGAGAWMLATHVVALFAGGMVAGRMSGALRGDGAFHGLGVWGVCTLFSAILLGGALGRSAAPSVRRSAPRPEGPPRRSAPPRRVPPVRSIPANWRIGHVWRSARPAIPRG